MKAIVVANIPESRRAWRSIIVRLPINYHPNLGFESDGEYERWEKVWCNKRKLRVFAEAVCKKFHLRKARVWSVGISRRHSCHFFIYNQDNDSPAKRALFKKVHAYVQKHAPVVTRQKGATSQALRNWLFS